MSTKQTSPLATTEQLRAAFSDVLVAARDRAIQEQRAAHQSKMAAQALEPAWKAKLEEALPGIETAALQSGNFSGDVLATWVDQAMEDYSKNNLRLTTDDLQKPHPSLWRIGGAAAVWKKTKPKAFDAWTEKFIAALDKVVALQAISAEQSASLSNALEAYTGELNALMNALAAFATHPEVAAVDAAKVTKVLERMKAFIKASFPNPPLMGSNAGNAKQAFASVLAASLDKMDTLETDLADIVFSVHDSAMTVTSYREALSKAEGVAALATQVDKNSATLMEADFGASAYFALASLEPLKMKQFLELYFDIGGVIAANLQVALRETLPAKGCSVEALLTCINAALAAYNAKGSPAVAVTQTLVVGLPPGVETDGPRINVNDFKFPGAFSTSQVQTTERSVKHVTVEVGKNPTKEKLELYLAEMVAACEAAKKEWVDTGRKSYGPKEYTEVERPHWRAHWRFRFKVAEGTSPNTLVYHIDSLYRKSRWVSP